jgi:hypothetical protein
MRPQPCPGADRSRGANQRVKTTVPLQIRLTLRRQIDFLALLQSGDYLVVGWLVDAQPSETPSSLLTFSSKHAFTSRRRSGCVSAIASIRESEC